MNAYLIDYGSVGVPRQFCAAILTQDIKDDEHKPYAFGQPIEDIWTLSCGLECIVLLSALNGLNRHYTLVVVEDGEDIQSKDNTRMEADGTLDWKLDKHGNITVTIAKTSGTETFLSRDIREITASLLQGRDE
jgi:hypothetical protein